MVEMIAYSMDLRDRVVAACDEGALTREEIAEQFSVSTAWIRRLLQRRRECGSYAAKIGLTGRKAIFQGDSLHKLEQLVAQQPDATLVELRERSGVLCSLTTVFHTLARLGYRRKKRRCGPRSRIVRTSRGSGGRGDARYAA